MASTLFARVGEGIAGVIFGGIVVAVVACSASGARMGHSSIASIASSRSSEHGLRAGGEGDGGAGAGGGEAHADRSLSPPASRAATAGRSARAAHGARPKPPRDELTLDEARRYMVALINFDRDSLGLEGVEFDDGSATAAGQAHAEDMATNGYLGHWGTDGSVPEQRYSDAGGSDMVLENASCFVDQKHRRLDKRAVIAPRNVEKAEEMFFDEVPPHDGHRKNILRPYHTRVGIGIAQPVATPTEIPVPCFTQEFVDAYGDYAAVPKRMRLGDTLHVEGAIHAPATVGGVGLARVDPPVPLSAAEANTPKRRSYPVPSPSTMYWPRGFKTPIPLQVSGSHFAIDVPVAAGAAPGMYELSIWARMPGGGDPQMVGIRTILVR